MSLRPASRMGRRRSTDRLPAARTVAGADPWRHGLRERPGPGGAGRAQRGGARPSARRHDRCGPRQARVRYRSRCRHDHLPRRVHGRDQHLQDRVPRSQLRDRNVSGLPAQSRCCPGKSRRFIRLQDHERLLQAGRRALADPATAEHLGRDRPRIERLLGLLAHRYGARKSRYIGSAKARLQAAWVAALVNLNPIGHRLAAQRT
jgi:Transposase DDE domain